MKQRPWDSQRGSWKAEELRIEIDGVGVAHSGSLPSLGCLTHCWCLQPISFLQSLVLIRRKVSRCHSGSWYLCLGSCNYSLLDYRRVGTDHDLIFSIYKNNFPQGDFQAFLKVIQFSICGYNECLWQRGGQITGGFSCRWTLHSLLSALKMRFDHQQAEI